MVLVTEVCLQSHAKGNRRNFLTLFLLCSNRDYPIPVPQVAAVLAAIEATALLADYAPKIFSYLDGPKTLAELQNAATRPAPPGYEIHHIVEAQRGSDNPQSNARNFPDLIDSAENLVRIPYWKHVEISSWYSTKNERYGGSICAAKVGTSNTPLAFRFCGI